jgi:NAD(P)H dehydrogenase (quinone)
MTMNYLVTGATGGFGGYALDYLSQAVAKENIYALVRSEEKGKALRDAGYNVRIGDYANEQSMNDALQGIDRVLFVSGEPGNRQEEHENVVNAAKQAGVSFIVYTSFPDADHSTSFLSPDHLFTEKALKNSGIQHTFVRNNWYLENELPLIEGALKSGKFVYMAANGKTGWALKREYAEAAVNVLVGNDFPEILELSHAPITYAELAEALKEASGQSFDVVAADEERFVDNLVEAGFPESVAEVFVAIQKDIEASQLDVVSNDFEDVLGKPLTDRVAAIKELLNA